MVKVKRNGYFGEVGCGGFEVVDDGCVGCEEAELARIA